MSSSVNMTSFLRAIALGFGIFSILLGVVAKLYGVGSNAQIFWSIGAGAIVLTLRFTLFRRPPSQGIK